MSPAPLCVTSTAPTSGRGLHPLPCPGGVEGEGVTPSSSFVKTQRLRHTNHPRQLRSRCNSFAAPICCEREEEKKKTTKKKAWKKPEMSNITGEASQNRCPHLAPTAASSHRIRGVPGRTLPCSCLSPKIKRASEQKASPAAAGDVWLLLPAAAHLVEQSPAARSCGPGTLGWQGRDWGGLGGLSANGAACPVWVFLG